MTWKWCHTEVKTSWSRKYMGMKYHLNAMCPIYQIPAQIRNGDKRWWKIWWNSDTEIKVKTIRQSAFFERVNVCMVWCTVVFVKNEAYCWGWRKLWGVDNRWKIRALHPMCLTGSKSINWMVGLKKRKHIEKKEVSMCIGNQVRCYLMVYKLWQLAAVSYKYSGSN